MALHIRDYEHLIPNKNTDESLWDWYDAILAAVNDLKNLGGGLLVFDPGIYYINRYKITGGPEKNQLVDIVFSEMKNFKIIGYGAKLDVKGDFHRSEDYQLGNQKFSYRNSIQPMVFKNCSNFSVEGFEIDGNVDRMTLDPGVAEGQNYGIYTSGCQNYQFLNLYVHHWATDGLFLGHFSPTDKNALLLNVKSSNNGRQACSILQLNKGTFINCDFSYSGVTEGLYPGHSLFAGLDIEPILRAPDKTDLDTGNLTFINCTFNENKGAQLIATHYYVKDVKFESCRFLPGTTCLINEAVMVGQDNTIFENCYFDLGARNGFMSYGNRDDRIRTILRNCEIRSEKSGIVSIGDRFLLIEDCRLIRVWNGNSYRSEFTPYLINKKAVMKNSYIFIPKEYYIDLFGAHDISRIEAKISESNMFETDYNDIANKDRHYATIYGTNTKVKQDEYSSKVGEYKFRPKRGAKLTIFSKGFNHLGDQLAIGYTDNAWFIQLFKSSMSEPKSGMFSKGDVVLNASPNPGGVIGWVCTTGGMLVENKWEPRTTYSIGNIVFSNNGNYECIEAGVSGDREITGNGSSIKDGTVVWKYLDVVAVLKSFGSIAN